MVVFCSDDIFFPSSVFFGYPFALSFSRLILCLSFLFSSSVCFKFLILSEHFFFVYAKAALAYSQNE